MNKVHKEINTGMEGFKASSFRLRLIIPTELVKICNSNFHLDLGAQFGAP